MKATCNVMETEKMRKKIVQDDVACIRCVGIIMMSRQIFLYHGIVWYKEEKNCSIIFFDVSRWYNVFQFSKPLCLGHVIPCMLYHVIPQ